MRLLFSLQLLWLALYTLVAADKTQTDNAWILKRDTAGNNGGCTDAYQLIIYRWNEEAVMIALNAIEELNKYGTDMDVRIAVTTFFGLTPIEKKTGSISDGNLKKVKASWNNLASYLQTGQSEGLLAKSYLFCDSTWLKKQALSDTARDAAGQEMFKRKKPITIQAAYGSDATGDPFWSSDLNSYLFAPAGSGDTICTTITSLQGVTAPSKQHSTNKAFTTVTICPRAFTNPNYLEILPTSKTGLVDAKGAAFAKDTSLGDALPRSATLFHEALHVTEQGAFLSVAEELYAVAECVNPSFAPTKKRRNPESYVFFAMAMWYKKLGLDFSTSKLMV